MERSDYIMEERADAVKEFIDTIPIEAIKAARDVYVTELKHTRGVLHSAFPKYKPGFQAIIEDLDCKLKELNAWLEELE